MNTESQPGCPPAVNFCWHSYSSHCSLPLDFSITIWVWWLLVQIAAYRGNFLLRGRKYVSCDYLQFMKKHTNVYSHKLFQFSSVTQSYPTLCDPKDCSTSGLPVHHQLLEFTQTHVHWVDDAIQPSHPLSSPSPPLSSPSPPVLNFSGIRIFSNESVLHIRWPKYWSFSFSISPSNTTVQKHQFFGAQLSLWSNSHIHTSLLEKP